MMAGPVQSSGVHKWISLGRACSRVFWLAALSVLLGCAPASPADSTEPRTPATIISVVPSATEMLFALGVGDRVVAIGDYDHFPPEVETLPRIGGLLNPNIEKIIEMRPDLVVTYGTQSLLRERLDLVGIRFYPFTHGGVEPTLEYLLQLGKTVGAEKQARDIVDRIHATFDALRASQPASRPTVLLVHNRGAGLLGSLYSVGARAFQHELIEIAGGRNVLGDLDQEVVQPTIEEVIRSGPEVIIETIPLPARPVEIAQRLKDWQALERTPAVVNKRVFVVAEDYLLVPGSRLDLAARRFAELIRQQ